MIVSYEAARNSIRENDGRQDERIREEEEDERKKDDYTTNGR